MEFFRLLGLRAQLCQAMHAAEERRAAPRGAEEIPPLLQEAATLQQGLRHRDTVTGTPETVTAHPSHGEMDGR